MSNCITKQQKFQFQHASMIAAHGFQILRIEWNAASLAANRIRVQHEASVHNMSEIF